MRQGMRACVFLMLILSAWVVVCVPECFGSEQVPAWRKPYNIVMLWVNFGILVGLFIKFARKPLMEALRGIHDKIKTEIDGISKRHRDVKKDMDSEESRLREIEAHLEEIRARIIEMGEKEKQRIIDQAKVSAKKMIDDAKAYARFQMTRAKKQLSDEMVDMAINMVEERLRQEISKEDNEKLVNEFLGNLETTKPHLN